jgi:hypothetical protein
MARCRQPPAGRGCPHKDGRPCSSATDTGRRAGHGTRQLPKGPVGQ